MIAALIALSTIAVGWGVIELIDNDDDNNDDSSADGLNRVNGTDGADTIQGTDVPDLISGRGGADNIHGQDGSDRIFGQQGNDTLFGDSGRDLIEGGTGDDVVNGDGWHDTLGGGSGDDTLRGGSGRDILIGNDGDDRLEGGDWDDRLLGGNGNDQLFGGNGNDVLTGGLALGADEDAGDMGFDVSAQFVEAAQRLAETEPEFIENGTDAEIFAHPIFRGIDTPATLPEITETGNDTLFGEAGNDKLFLGSGDVGNGGAGKDIFTISDNSKPGLAIIEDYVPGDDLISIEVDDSDVNGPRTITVLRAGSDAIVELNGEPLARVLGAAGRLSAGDIKFE